MNLYKYSTKDNPAKSRYAVASSMAKIEKNITNLISLELVATNIKVIKE